VINISFFKNKLLVSCLVYLVIVGIIKYIYDSNSFLIILGLIEITVGGLASGGSMSVQGEYDLKYDQKLPQMNIHKTPERFGEEDKSLSFMVVMSGLGVATLIIGII